MRVCLVFSGMYTAVMRWRARRRGGAGTARISFFFAAMMPLSVAYRSWLMPL